MPNIVRFQTSYEEPYPLEVRGESFYKENIGNVSNYLGEDEGVNVDDLIAHLVLENENKSDPGNAVRIEIDGKIVGYLSRPSARLYRQKLINLGIPDAIGECSASVKGGFIKRDGSQADFGVRLDIDLNALQVIPAVVPKTVISSNPIEREKNMTVQNNVPVTVYAVNTSNKKKSTALWLCIFLGLFGGHYFYVGRFGKGILYLFTGGLFAFGWIIDIFVIAAGSFKDNVGAPLRK
jgi:restriction system protein